MFATLAPPKAPRLGASGETREAVKRFDISESSWTLTFFVFPSGSLHQKFLLLNISRTEHTRFLWLVSMINVNFSKVKSTVRQDDGAECLHTKIHWNVTSNAIFAMGVTFCSSLFFPRKKMSNISLYSVIAYCYFSKQRDSKRSILRWSRNFSPLSSSHSIPQLGANRRVGSHLTKVRIVDFVVELRLICKYGSMFCRTIFWYA